MIGFRKTTVIKVCTQNCENKPYKADVKGKKMTFCCETGFKKSLEDFAKSFK